MRNLRKLKVREEELLNQLSTYKWWGNEDDEDYQEEYSIEYEPLETELFNVRYAIRELTDKSINKNK